MLNRILKMPKLWSLLLLAIVASSATAQMSVPPAYFRGDASPEARTTAQMRLPAGAPARTITLAPPAAGERTPLKAPRASSRSRPTESNKNRRLEIGFAREVPAPDNAVRLADLPWRRAANGAHAARIALTSPGAVAIRIELALDGAPAELSVRFAGSREGAPVFGPYSAADIGRDPVFWSPVLEGETGTIELELPATVPLGNSVLLLPMISHLGVPGAKLKALDAYIGQAEACEQDVACVAPALQQQLATAIHATARIFVTVWGVTLICSGTLLNDAQGSFTPYFLTTNHCIDDVDDPAASKGVPAAAASTVNTYWFFQASTCGSQAQPNYVLIADGAKLLARGADFDWSLLRLNSAPPAGTTFAAWNASGPLPTGTAVTAIHHPSGDLKKVSQGKVSGYLSYPDGSSFIESQWTSGATEAGSSGGGLFVLGATNGVFELRGALVGGNSSCSFSQGIDAFSRFDVTFPLIQQYLAPGAANPTRITPVVEFFNAARTDYLITADPSEIAALDGGSPAGWVRTGLRFLAYTDPAVAPAIAQPVCRFYVPPAFGDTHFLSASPQECADTLARFGSTWIHESSAAFYVALPDAVSGICPANTRAIYRFLSNTNPYHRRYTSEVLLRDSIIEDGGWTQEGFGHAPDQVVMCAPSGDSAVIVPPSTATNFEGIWQAAPAGSESGWGINLAHQGDVIYATWFTYDASGKGWWLSMTATRTTANSFTGLLIQTSGPPYSALPFDPGQVTRTPIGASTLTFSGTDIGTFAYALSGTAQTKTITRFVFDTVPTCTYSAQPNFVSATNYQGLWEAAAFDESGWGATLTHQGNVIFAVWYTYDLNGAPLWLSAAAFKVAPGIYSGTFYRTTGPAFNASPFDPAAVVRTPAGTMSLAFANGNMASFSYTLNGLTQVRSIARTLFRHPAGTLCH